MPNDEHVAMLARGATAWNADVAANDSPLWSSPRPSRLCLRQSEEILEIDVGSDAPALQIVGSEINDLLRRARTLEGQRRLSEYRLASRLECLDALPSIPDMIW